MGKWTELAKTLKDPYQVGQAVTFSSPLFGKCTGTVHAVEHEYIWIIDHSVLKGEDEPCRLPTKWIQRVYPDMKTDVKVPGMA